MMEEDGNRNCFRRLEVDERWRDKTDSRGEEPGVISKEKIAIEIYRYV
jgi:hypothetical protein